ncbi:MAG: hypothetical protein MJE66_05755 [Proteobacteria bacterium]|nr:hypothetical protein [Pseudomonadota bacterium]
MVKTTRIGETVLLVGLQVLLLGCTPRYFDEFQRSNPAWDPGTFPRIGSGLHEVLAGLDQPHDHPTLQIKIFEVTNDAWRRVSKPDLKPADGKPLGSHLVVARISCRGLSYTINNLDSWYLLVQDRLVAYHHVGFNRYCTGAALEVREHWVPSDYLSCLTDFLPQAIRTEISQECGASPIPGASI